MVGWTHRVLRRAPHEPRKEETMADLEFVESLPKRSTGRGGVSASQEMQELAAKLAERPKQWAKVAQAVSQISRFYQLKQLGCKLTLRAVGSESYERNGEAKERRLYDVYAM